MPAGDAEPGTPYAPLRAAATSLCMLPSAISGDLAALVAYCDRHDLAEWPRLDAQHVRSFAAHEHRDGLGPRSIQRRLSAVRGFANYLIREGILTSNPAIEIRAPKAPKRLPQTLSQPKTRRADP